MREGELEKEEGFLDAVEKGKSIKSLVSTQSLFIRLRYKRSVWETGGVSQLVILVELEHGLCEVRGMNESRSFSGPLAKS